MNLLSGQSIRDIVSTNILYKNSIKINVLRDEISIKYYDSLNCKRDVGNKTAVHLTVVDLTQTMGGSGSTLPLRVGSSNKSLHPLKVSSDVQCTYLGTFEQ